MVLLFSLTGVYLVSFNTMDIHVMAIVALIAIGLRLLTFPMAPCCSASSWEACWRTTCAGPW